MNLKTLKNVNLNGKRVLMRVDLNVPIKDGKVQDDTRIRAILPTLNHILKSGASLALLTHLGRPKGRKVESLKTDAIQKQLEDLIEKSVKKVDGCVEDFVKKEVLSLKKGEILLLENIRFYPEEKENDKSFSEKLAISFDLFVNDAFGALHRAHASTEGVTHHLPSFAGFLIEKEIKILSGILISPQRPLCLIVGGAKIDTKIGVLERFIDIADEFLIGGALANTFLASMGLYLGDSLFQKEKIDVANKFLKATKSNNKRCILPEDIVISAEITNEAKAFNVDVSELKEGMKILDIGKLTIEKFKKSLSRSKTIIWNGPMGLYEYAPFEGGTREIIKAIADSDAETIVGGGDSIDALKKYDYKVSDFTHVSTGGGAMLEYLEGKELPALKALQS